MSDELFPVRCPTCGVAADHDGVGSCSRIIASLNGTIARLSERVAELERRERAHAARRSAPAG